VFFQFDIPMDAAVFGGVAGSGGEADDDVPLAFVAPGLPLTCQSAFVCRFLALSHTVWFCQYDETASRPPVVWCKFVNIWSEDKQ